MRRWVTASQKNTFTDRRGKARSGGWKRRGRLQEEKKYLMGIALEETRFLWPSENGELALTRWKDSSSAETSSKKKSMDKVMLISESDMKLKESTSNYFSFLLEVELSYQKIMRQDKGWKIKWSMKWMEDETRNKYMHYSVYLRVHLCKYCFLVLLICMVAWFYLAKFRKLPRYEERDCGIEWFLQFCQVVEVKT